MALKMLRQSGSKSPSVQPLKSEPWSQDVTPRLFPLIVCFCVSELAAGLGLCLNKCTLCMFPRENEWGTICYIISVALEFSTLYRELMGCLNPRALQTATKGVWGKNWSDSRSVPPSLLPHLACVQAGHRDVFCPSEVISTQNSSFLSSLLLPDSVVNAALYFLVVVTLIHTVSFYFRIYFSIS